MKTFARVTIKFASLFSLCVLFLGMAFGQDNALKDAGIAGIKDEGIKAVPFMVNYASYFTRVTAGQVQASPSFAPLLLVPL